MTRADRFALFISLLAILISYLVADRVFERMAHLEDEQAYVWQAQAIAGGHIAVPSPPQPKEFLVPFVVDYHNQRFGKYPLGWPVILAFGILLGLRDWVNPILAGVGAWLTYRLGKFTFGESAGLLAAGLTLTSPFFLVNSGSLLSHPLGLVLSSAFTLSWLDAFTGTGEVPARYPGWLPVLVSAFSLGLLGLTRPLTAVAVGLPFAFHGLYLFIRSFWGSPGTRAERFSIRLRLLSLGAIVVLITALHFVWQWAVTGDPFLNPYTLWWPYDKIGFGPGVGRVPGGHTLYQAYWNTRYSLQNGFIDLFGWDRFSLLFIPFGILAGLRNQRAWLMGSVFPSLLIVYLAYWIGSSLFGPRYYYEGLFSLTILSGAGIALLAGWSLKATRQLPALARLRTGRMPVIRPILVGLLVLGLVGYNLAAYLPGRLQGMHGLYGIQRARLEPFLLPDAQKLAPGLVIVYPRHNWTEYGTLLELEDPYLNSAFIFVHTQGPAADQAVAAAFPERRTIYYYPDEPYKLYLYPRE